MASSEIVTIDPNGDVVLVCGVESNTKKIRVSSAILSQASDVFKALLSPRFKEGAELATSSTVEVPLPDDDPDTMSIICNVLHMRNNSVPRTLDPLEIIDIAVLTDKYACMEPLRFVANIWIEPHMTMQEPSQLSKLLTSAFYFHDTRLFENICQNLVWRSIGPIEANDMEDPHALLRVLETLEKQRMQSLRQITNIIEDALHKMFPRACLKMVGKGPCFSCRAVLSFPGHLAEKSLWPASTRENQRLLDLMTQLRALHYQEDPYCQTDIKRTNPTDVIAEVKSKTTKIESHIKIPCLGCIREGNVNLSNLACDHK